MKTTIADLIGQLTHSVDALEVAVKGFRITSRATEEHYSALCFEVARLHGVLDGLNALYEDVADREADAAFENAGC